VRIIKEAKKIISSDKVNLTSYGNNREFYVVADVKIELRLGKPAPFIICTCKNCSVHADKELLCSYKIALLVYLYGNSK
jgi:hypothetical protein